MYNNNSLKTKPQQNKGSLSYRKIQESCNISKSPPCFAQHHPSLPQQLQNASIDYFINESFCNNPLRLVIRVISKIGSSGSEGSTSGRFNAISVGGNGLFYCD